MESKICTGCKIEKSLNEFYKKSGRKNAKESKCKICRNISIKSYRENNDIGLADLRYLKVLHYNFNGNVQVGEVIVNAQLAEYFLSAFKSLYEEHYEIIFNFFN